MIKNDEFKKIEKKPRKEKKVKPVKKFPAKKLPGLLKKSYSQKQFNKRILKKIYIEEDKNFVVSLFSETFTKGKNEKIRIPRSSEFTKKELTSLKVLAKSIKKNKGRIKSASFIAVAVAVAVIVGAVSMFKNPVAKWGIRSAMQGIFGAVCDIGSVDVKIFGAQITVRNLAQANPDSPMRNVFSFDKLDIDFNLTQLLRARFNAQNLEITGIALNTERKTSGALPAKVVRKKEKNSGESPFYTALKERASSSLGTAKDAVSELFAQYDPQKLVANIQSNLKTKAVAHEIESSMKVMIDEWKDRPDEIKKSVEEFKASSERLTGLNTAQMKNPAEIKAVIENIQSLLAKGAEVKKNVGDAVSAVEADNVKVQTMRKNLDDAVKSDRELIRSQIPEFSVEGLKNTVSSAFDGMAYGMLGKYYPYLRKAISYAASMKKNSDAGSAEKKKKEKKSTKKTAKRYAGRTVYWRKDRVPSLFIENVHGSGAGIDVRVTNISNDMDKTGVPIVATGTYSTSSQVHRAGCTIDARSESTQPLIKGTYSGSHFPFSLDMAKQFNSDFGLVFAGKTSVEAELTADSDFSFGGKGAFYMNPLTVTAAEIKPEFANRIFSEALSALTSMNLAASFGFSEAKGVSMRISSDADDILASALKTVAAKEFSTIKDSAIEKVSEELASYTAGATAKFGNFSEIFAKLKDSQAASELLTKQLETKKEELMKKISESAASAVSGKAAEMLKTSGSKNSSEKATESLKNFGALKNLKK